MKKILFIAMAAMFIFFLGTGHAGDATTRDISSTEETVKIKEADPMLMKKPKTRTGKLLPYPPPDAGADEKRATRLIVILLRTTPEKRK